MSKRYSQEKLKLAKKIWLNLLIVLIINDVIAQTVITFGQSGPNPFNQYLPELANLGYLLAGILFLMGIVVYRKDYSYAILLISAAALVAGLVNQTMGVNGNGNAQVIQTVPVYIYIKVSYGNTVLTFNGTSFQTTSTNVGTFRGSAGTPIYVQIRTYPPVPISEVIWYVDGATKMEVHPNTPSYQFTIQTSSDIEGSNTIFVGVSYPDQSHNRIYFGTGGVEFKYQPSYGWLFDTIIDALNSFFGAISSIPSIVQQILAFPFEGVINGLVMSPTLGGNGAGKDAENMYYYFQNLAISIGFVLIALGIGINAMRGGYSDIVDLGTDFFYRTGVFLLFSYGGIEIYNAIANSLNQIAQYIISNVIVGLASSMTTWSIIAIGLFVGSFAVPVGKEALAQMAMFLFELDMATIAFSYVRQILIYTLASMIPLLAALWTFEWTRGIATTLSEMLATLVFGGLVDALFLYYGVKVGGWLFFFSIPLMLFAFFMIGIGIHQATKHISSGISSRIGSIASSISHRRSSDQQNQNKNDNKSEKSQGSEVPIQQVLIFAPTPPQKSQQNLPSTSSAIKQLGGQVDSVQLSRDNKFVSITKTSKGYHIIKGIMTSTGTVTRQYIIPAKASIREVASGLEKNFLNKQNTNKEIDPNIIGQFFDSIENANISNTQKNINNSNANSSNVKP